MRRNRRFALTTLTILLFPALICLAGAKEEAEEILGASGVKGGLIVHIGSGEGELTAALCANDAYIVHGLDADAEKVAKARSFVQSLSGGAGYGQVSIELLKGGSLPYIDNTVNLVFFEKLGKVGMDEVKRVLAPEGMAYYKKGNVWKKTIKPRPGEIDVWTHYLHDPTNNAVAHDTAVDLPRHMQWVGGPKWGRHHDHMSSSSAVVSSGNRNFYIFDEGTKASILLPSQWFVIARDAFNGKILWKRPIEKWHTTMWRLKSGPAQLPRRLVAVGDTVYVTLSLDAPVTALDAATGETIRTYEQTKATEEILVADGVMYVVVNKSPVMQPLDPKQHDYRVHEGERWVMAVEAESGETIWEKKWRWVVPITLTVDKSRVLFFDGEKVVCLGREDGEELWRSEELGKRLSVPSYFAPTLVSYEDVVLFSGSDTGSKDYHVDNGLTLTALNAKTGETMWKAPSPPSGYRSPEDILVVDGLVWTDSHMWGRNRDDFPNHEWGVFTGRDLRTGDVKIEFPPDVETYWFHHRCHRAKATDKYLLPSRTGIEFVDPKTKHWVCNHWVRGACLYGIMPANGMIYNSPHPCACYLEAKLYGFNALAPTSASRKVPARIKEKGRLEKGPAYRSKIKAAPGAGDWPTYRHDSHRSGFSKTAVPAKLGEKWEAELGGKLSSIVAAEGRLFVAQVDAHQVRALDAKSGKQLWKYTAGGRVDSPPTIWKGRALFGCRDGYVYCLRAADGELIWRYRAAPVDRRLVAFEQVESVWPVHGSVLVKDGVLWCAAGRSMFLDGGIRLLKLDPETGTKISEKVLDDRDPETGENLQMYVKGLNMVVALPDILSADEEYVYMRSQKFDEAGNRIEIEAPTGNSKSQKGPGAHLFCPTGFLDDAYWHRSYWLFGQRWTSGAGGYFRAGRFAPSGRLLVFDDSNVYGFSRRAKYFKWTTPIERQLFSSSKDAEPVRVRPAPKGQGFSGYKAPDIEMSWHWGRDIPLHVRAMALADKTLFVAGPPDIVDEEKSLANFASEQVQAKLAEQDDILAGDKGALLRAVSAADGELLAEYKLDTLPAWDGMIAANERLYLATTDGRVICMAGE